MRTYELSATGLLQHSSKPSRASASMADPRDGKCLQPLEMVVLVEMMRNNTTDYSATRLCYPIPVRNGRSLTHAQRRLAAAAGGSFRGPAEEIRASLPGEQGITLGPARRATMKVLLKQLSADSAAPIRFNPLD